MMIILVILIITANVWLYIVNIQDGDTFFAIISALGIVTGLITFVLETMKWLIKRSRARRSE